MLTKKVVEPMVDWMFLIPTSFEREILRSRWPQNLFTIAGQKIQVAQCGFGTIVSAAQTIRLIQQYRPTSTLLMGIAGTYTDRLQIGQAYCFNEVGCYGVGIGSGAGFISAEKAGWQHWEGNGNSAPIGDRISLHPTTSFFLKNRPNPQPDGNSPQANRDDRFVDATAGCLLTVAAASANVEQSQQKLTAFQDAEAEDMEGFGVAVACRLAGVPLTIVRGISNRAGDRDKSNWKIDEALLSAAALSQKLIQLFEESE